MSETPHSLESTRNFDASPEVRKVALESFKSAWDSEGGSSPAESLEKAGWTQVKESPDGSSSTWEHQNFPGVKVKETVQSLPGTNNKATVLDTRGYGSDEVVDLKTQKFLGND